MKRLLIILGAAAIAGLAAHAIAEGVGKLSLGAGGYVMIPVDVLVAMIAGIGILAAGLALAFDRSVGRADQAITASREQRVARLENERRPNA